MLLGRSDFIRDRYISPTTAGPALRLGLAHSGDLHINYSLCNKLFPPSNSVIQAYKTVSMILNTLYAGSLWLMYRVLNVIYKKNSGNVMNSPSFTDSNLQTVAYVNWSELGVSGLWV